MKTLLFAALVLFSGCVSNIRSTLVDQVVFDEKCPAQQVKVVEWGPWQQSARVEACGRQLSYSNHSSGDSTVAQWQQNPASVPQVREADSN